METFLRWYLPTGLYAVTTQSNIDSMKRAGHVERKGKMNNVGKIERVISLERCSII
jgi:hypothetical protein